MRNDIFAAVDEEVAHLNIPSSTQRNITLVSHQVQIPIEKGQCLIILLQNRYITFGEMIGMIKSGQFS